MTIRIPPTLLAAAAVPLVAAGLVYWTMNYDRLMGLPRFDVAIRADTVAAAVSDARASRAPVAATQLNDGTVRLFPVPQDTSALRFAVAKADPARGAIVAREGTKAGAPACQSCHGELGWPPPDQDAPRLAGLEPRYAARQLEAYATGQRANDIMTDIGKALSLQDMADVAAYFAMLPGAPPQVDKATVQAASADPLIAQGRLLHLAGRNEAALQACANCHGEDAGGGRPLIPGLLGLKADYITAQLAAYKAGTRKGDAAADLMRAIAERLSDEDARALGAYYASLGAGSR